jgi:hypothetical protein
MHNGRTQRQGKSTPPAPHGVIASFLLSYLPGLKTLFEQYLKNPPAAIAASMLLIFQPPLMDILPMYICSLSLLPWYFGLLEG